LLLAGCASITLISAMAKNLDTHKAGTKVPDDKVMVVGKIVLDPVPAQEIQILGGDSLKGAVSLGFTRDAKKEIHWGKNDSDNTAQVPWAQYFALLLPRKESTYLKGVSVALKVNSMNGEYIVIPCTLTVPFAADERVVYIGDITFKFDQANSMGGTSDTVDVVDAFDAASSSYNNVFKDSSGAMLPLAKHLASGSGPVTITKVHEQQVVQAY